MVQKVDHLALEAVVISHIFSNINGVQAVFRPSGFDISNVTPAFN